MCTITLTYDPEDKQAQQSLAALLSTGLFTQVTSDSLLDPLTDEHDAWLFEDHGDMPLPKDKELFTPEEAYDIIMDDIRKIYEQKYAV